MLHLEFIRTIRRFQEQDKLEETPLHFKLFVGRGGGGEWRNPKDVNKELLLRYFLKNRAVTPGILASWALAVFLWGEEKAVPK